MYVYINIYESLSISSKWGVSVSNVTVTWGKALLLHVWTGEGAFKVCPQCFVAHIMENLWENHKMVIFWPQQFLELITWVLNIYKKILVLDRSEKSIASKVLFVRSVPKNDF